MYYFSKQYQKYDSGGATNPGGTGADQSTLNAGLGIANTATGLIDAMVPANDYGRKPIVVGALSGAAKGAMLGSAAGPIGAGVGAVAGAAYGYFTGAAAKRKEVNANFAQAQTQQNWLQNRSRAVLAQQPELASGNVGAGYYAGGGMLSKNYLANTPTEGGSLTPLNSDAVQVNGPSHEQGGVQLPDSNAEVEGNETMQDNFVFSERLGFAQEHKRLASAIGKIEDKKVMTPERVTSVKRMNDRIQKLALSQEYLKHTMAHFGQPVE